MPDEQQYWTVRLPREDAVRLFPRKTAYELVVVDEEAAQNAGWRVLTRLGFVEAIERTCFSEDEARAAAGPLLHP